MNRLTNAMRDALVRVADAFKRGDTETVDVSQETLECFCEHGLLNYDPGSKDGWGTWYLTEKGFGEVNLRRREQEEAKEKRNAASRARNDAMRSVGMKRTRYGWE